MTDEIVIDPSRPPRTWDFFLTVFGLFLLLVITVIYVITGLGYGVRTLGCADSPLACNDTAITAGALLAIIGTPIIAVAGAVLTVIWIARRKLSFVMPLAAIAVATLVFMLSGWLVDSAVS